MPTFHIFISGSQEVKTMDNHCFCIFRSPDCFEIGWPLRLDHDFFCVQSAVNCKVKKARGSLDAEKEKSKGEEMEDEEQGVNKLTELT